GRLTGADTGPGRMSEPDDIAARARELLAQSAESDEGQQPNFEPTGSAATIEDFAEALVDDLAASEAFDVAPNPATFMAHHSGDLRDVHVLVTAGGTREPIDPVRFIGNRSSGRQGVALAAAA